MDGHFFSERLDDSAEENRRSLLTLPQDTERQSILDSIEEDQATAPCLLIRRNNQS